MDTVRISEVNIFPIKPKDGLVAFASFVLNNSFFIGNVAVYTRLARNGYRLVYPARTLPNGKKIQSFHPINRQSARVIEDQVFEVFAELTEKVMMREGKINNGRTEG